MKFKSLMDAATWKRMMRPQRVKKSKITTKDVLKLLEQVSLENMKRKPAGKELLFLRCGHGLAPWELTLDTFMSHYSLRCYGK